MPSLEDNPAFIAACRPIRFSEYTAATKPAKKNNPEGKIQDAIIDYLLLRGFFVIRINSSVLPGASNGARVPSYVAHVATGKGKKLTAGHPDVVAYKGTQAIFFEVKTPEAYRSKNNGASDRQLRFKEILEQRGANAHIVCSVEQVGEVLLECGL